MKLKKQLLAYALVLSLGVAAGTLPQGAINPPSPQLAHHLGTLMGWWALLPYDQRFPQPDSAGCYPWTLSVHCTGRPPLPGEQPPRIPGFSG